MQLRLITCLALSALALVGSAAAAQDVTPAESARIDKIVTAALARTGTPSASIAIVRGGRIVLARAWGRQNDAAGPPDASLPYQIASNSKQFTAAALLLLEDAGKLSLDDKVAKFLPGITGGDQISIRQLLSHTSGLQDYYPQDYTTPYSRSPVSPQGIVDRWAKKPLDFVPGTKWQYSNTGYVVAGLIAEKEAGMPLMTYLRQRILTPLGIRATGIDDAVGPGFPMGYNRAALGPVRPAEISARGWLYAAGELAMSATDLAKWDIARIERSLLPADDWAAQEATVKLADGTDTHYGLGVFESQQGGHRVIAHGGESSGFLSTNNVYPDDKIAVVVLTNGDFGDAHRSIANAIGNVLLPPTGDDAVELAAARSMFDQLAAGRLDSALLTDDARYYFTAERRDDYAKSLAPLGEPEGFEQLGPMRLRGGFINRNYRISFGARKLTVITYREPDGTRRYEQFLVMPGE